MPLHYLSSLATAAAATAPVRLMNCAFISMQCDCATTLCTADEANNSAPQAAK
jgi:hypothetical protein